MAKENSVRSSGNVCSKIYFEGVMTMASNRGVAFIKPGEVKVQNIDFPKLFSPVTKRKIEHGVILKIVSTNICGSDQHMVRGRTTAPAGLVLGHRLPERLLRPAVTW